MGPRLYYYYYIIINELQSTLGPINKTEKIITVKLVAFLFLLCVYQFAENHQLSWLSVHLVHTEVTQKHPTD